jgi:Papain family cysteine protease
MIQFYKKTIPYRRDKGVISFIKPNTKCWLSAPIGLIETMNAIKTGYLVELSVQQMIDCKPNLNCHGSDVSRLLSWLYNDQVGIVKSDDYSNCDGNSTESVKLSDFSMNK